MSRLNAILLVFVAALAGLSIYLFLNSSEFTSEQSFTLLNNSLEKFVVPLVTACASLAGVWLQSVRQSSTSREEREQQRQWDVEDRILRRQGEYYAAKAGGIEQLAADILKVTERMSALKLSQYFGTDEEVLRAQLEEDVQTGVGALTYSLPSCLAFAEAIGNKELSTALQDLREMMNEVPRLLDRHDKKELNATELIDHMASVGIRLYHVARRVLVANERLQIERDRLLLNSFREGRK